MKLPSNQIVWFGILIIVIFHIVYLEAKFVKWLANARKWEEDLGVVMEWAKCVMDKTISAAVRYLFALLVAFAMQFWLTRRTLTWAFELSRRRIYLEVSLNGPAAPP